MVKQISYYILNGKFFTDRRNINTSNRSFRYGDGFFETVKIIDSKPFLWDFHLQRIFKTASFMGFHLINDFDKILSLNIKELLLKNNISEGGRLRLHFYRKDGGLYSPAVNDIDYLIEAESDNNGFLLNEKGIKLGLFDEIYKPNNKLSNFKLSSAVLYVLASKFAKDNLFDDVILLNSNKRVSEASSSNVFCVFGSKIFTPPLSESPLDGVMRKLLLSPDFNKILSEKYNLKFQEKQIELSDLKKADEVFLSNSIAGVKWVENIENKIFGNKVSSLINNELNKFSNKYINKYYE